jgi:hypothetical protein
MKFIYNKQTKQVESDSQVSPNTYLLYYNDDKYNDLNIKEMC